MLLAVIIISKFYLSDFYISVNSFYLYYEDLFKFQIKCEELNLNNKINLLPVFYQPLLAYIFPFQITGIIEG
jgi:hypothetical protein